MPRRALPLLSILALLALIPAQALADQGGDAFLGSGHSISADGRYVVFASGADGLSAEDNDPTVDIFRWDRTSGALQLVSTGSSGAANGASSQPQISADGRSVAFVSQATNLDPAAVTPGRSEIFVKDMATGTVALASRATGIEGAADSTGSDSFSLSGDGTTLAWSSTAAVAVDNPGAVLDSNGSRDVFVRLLGADLTREVGLSPDGTTAQGEVTTSPPSLSYDGSQVAFTTAAGLGLGDNDGSDDVYVVNLTGAQAPLLFSLDTPSVTGPAGAAALDPSGTRAAYVKGGNVFWGDSTMTLLASAIDGGHSGAGNVAAAQPQWAAGASQGEVGHLLTFLATSTALDPRNSPNGLANLYVRDIPAELTRRVLGDVAPGNLTIAVGAGDVTTDGLHFAIGLNANSGLGGGDGFAAVYAADVVTGKSLTDLTPGSGTLTRLGVVAAAPPPGDGGSGGGSTPGHDPIPATGGTVATAGTIASPASSTPPVGRPPAKQPLRCRKGFKKQTVRGRARCVKVKAKKHAGR